MLIVLAREGGKPLANEGNAQDQRQASDYPVNQRRQNFTLQGKNIAFFAPQIM